jgi:lysophospholipase L1-like esterase
MGNSTVDRRHVCGTAMTGRLLLSMLLAAALFSLHSDGIASEHRAAGVATQVPDARLQFRLHPSDRVVFFGDSITHQDLYTTLVASACRRNHPDWKLSFFTAGANGGTLTTALDRFTSQVVPFKPTVVLILFGMNDVYLENETTNPLKAPPVALFRRNYINLLDRFRRELPAARLVLCTTTIVEENRRKDLPNMNRGLQAFNRTVLNVAHEKRLPIVDLYTPMKAALNLLKATNANATFLPDGVHPTREGHRIIAESILKAWAEN